MRSKTRIKPFMKWLTEKWEAYPDLRFGQLLINEGIIADDVHTWNAEMMDYTIPQKAMREIQTWGTYGKEGGGKADVFIKDLETDHIKAILKTQTHIKDTSIEIILKEELKFRKNRKV